MDPACKSTIVCAPRSVESDSNFCLGYLSPGALLNWNRVKLFYEVGPSCWTPTFKPRCLGHYSSSELDSICSPTVCADAGPSSWIPTFKIQESGSLGFLKAGSCRQFKILFTSRPVILDYFRFECSGRCSS